MIVGYVFKASVTRCNFLRNLHAATFSAPFLASLLGLQGLHKVEIGSTFLNDCGGFFATATCVFCNLQLISFSKVMGQVAGKLFRVTPAQMMKQHNAIMSKWWSLAVTGTIQVKPCFAAHRSYLKEI